MYLIGASGHASVVFDILDSLGIKVTSFITPTGEEDAYEGVPVISEKDFKASAGSKLIIAIGDNGIRKRVSEKFTMEYYISAAHPSAIISPRVTISEGTVVMQGSVIQTRTSVGRHAIINTGAMVDHDCVIGDFAHIAPGAVLTGDVTVGEGALVGAGACVIQGKKIGKWSIVGAGATVIHDIPDFAVAVGNPARVIKINPR